MHVLSYTQKTVFLAFIVFATATTSRLSAWPVDILPEGPYPVASANFEVSLPTVGTVEDYLKGAFISGQPRYIASLINHPLSALSIDVAVPDVPELFGSYAGTTIPVTAYLMYPTTDANERPDYVFPYTNTGDNVFPHMQGPDEAPIPAFENKPLPLIVSSHGYTAHGLWDVAHMKFLASHGYLALSIFHGDNRISILPWPLRPLMVKAFVDYLLEHPLYGPMIDEERVGISGSSLGGNTVLAILGGGYMNHPEAITDPRFKAGFGIVPSVRTDYYTPFLADYSTLQNIHVPFMAVCGEMDTTTPLHRAMTALQQTSGITLAFELMGEEHIFSDLAWQDTQTLEVMFFDSFLKDSSTARETLMGITYVYGGVADYKILQRDPDAEAEDESETE